VKVGVRARGDRGFVRVAACTGHIVIADPEANAAGILRQARTMSTDGVDVAVFPELGLTGYSVEDSHLQDALLDDAEVALDVIKAASKDLRTVSHQDAS
jgi:NAD+ synthase (glutamine-hydrolysing)